MSKLKYQRSYRRRLPHIQPPGATLFITFRLAGSIPAEALARLRAETARVEKAISDLPDPQAQARRAYVEHRRLFAKWDTALDADRDGPRWLGNPEITTLMTESLHHRDNQVYDLDAFCVMSNHVHAVFTPLPKADGGYHAISTIMHSLKRYTARQANLLLGRQGNFWQHENYDHVVRDESEWRRIIIYMLNNPVRARLVQRWDEWQWTYCKYAVGQIATRSVPHD